MDTRQRQPLARHALPRPERDERRGRAAPGGGPAAKPRRHPDRGARNRAIGAGLRHPTAGWEWFYAGPPITRKRPTRNGRMPKASPLLIPEQNC